ncbi:MAG: ATP synthase F1 subunit delta [Terracidiphilus sp.]
MAAFVARYARAFADVVAEKNLDLLALDRQWEDFLASWNASAELRELFANPTVTAAKKVAILDVLNTRLGLQKELRNLLAVLIDHSRIGQVGEVAAACHAEIRNRLGIRKVEIVTARQLNEQDRARLLAGASQLAGTRIEASFRLDPSILGGTVVRIGSTVYDGSVRGRLDRLKEALMSG